MGSVLAFPIAAALAVLCRKRWEDTMLPVTTAMITVLLLSGMFTTFLPGVVFCILAALAATAFCVRAGLRDRQVLKSAVATPGVLFFLLFFLFFLFCDLGGVVAGKADTWAHWALAVKNYRFFDDLVIGSPSTDRYATYPPALPIWNYLSTRLWFRYSEGMTLLGQNMLYVTLLVPLCRTLPAGRHPRRFMILLFAGMTFPYLARSDAYLSLYADTVLALAAGYCMIQFYLLFTEKDRFYLWTAASGLFLLSLTKETGIAIGGLTVFAVTCHALITGKRKKLSASGIRPVMGLIPWGGFVLAPLIWYGFLYLAPDSLKTGSSRAAREAAAAIAARGAAANATKSVNHVVQILDPSRWLNRFEEWQYTAFKQSYLSGLFTSEYYGINLFLKFTPFAFLILILLVPWLRHLFAVRRETADTSAQERYRIGSELYYVLFGVTAFYDIILMPAMYLTLFPWGEVQNLASFPRYLTPLTVMTLYYTAFLFLKEAGERESVNNRRISGAIPYLVLLLFLLLSGPAHTIASLVIDRPERTMFWGLEHAEVTPQPGDVFLFVNDSDPEEDRTLRFYYRVSPARSNRSVLKMQIKDGTDERTGKDIVHEMTVEEFDDRLREEGVNYLYLDHVDAEFAGRYGAFFADGVPVGDGKLYSVDLSGEQPVCTLLGE